MPLAIKGVSTSNSCPTHSTGDLLVAFTQSTLAATGWTLLASKGTTWNYDSLSAYYRVANSSSTAAPFIEYPTSAVNPRVYSISGADATSPIAGVASGQAAAWSWSAPATIQSVSVPTASGASTGSVYMIGPNWNGYGYSSPWVTTNSNIAIGTSDFTIECWYNAKAFTGGGNWNYLFDIGANGATVVVQSGAIASYCGGTINSGTAGTTTGSWNHLAWVRSGGVSKLYVNGVATDSGVSLTASIPTAVCRIGAYGGGGYAWDGYISNFRVVKSAVYTGNFTPPSSPLAAIANTELLTCQSPTATPTDASGNNVGLTVGGGVFYNQNSPFASMGGGIRLSLFTAYGGGGNSPSLNTSPFWGGPSLNQVSAGTHHAYYEGGVGPFYKLYSPGYAGGGYAYVTVSINPAPTSGFFAMF